MTSLLFPIRAMAEEEQPLIGDELLDARDNEFSILAEDITVTKREKILGAVAIALFLACAVLFGLFTGTSLKLYDERHTPAPTVTATQTATVTVVPRPAPTAPAEVCLSTECVTIAAEILQRVDTSVDPCEDFYGFSNNGWVRNNPLPSGKARFGMFNSIEQANKHVLRAVLKSKHEPTSDAQDAENLESIRNFYDSCLDEDAQDAAGVTPLGDIVSHLVDLLGKGVTPPPGELRGEKAGEDALSPPALVIARADSIAETGFDQPSDFSNARSLSSSVESPASPESQSQSPLDSLHDSPSLPHSLGASPSVSHLTAALAYAHSRQIPVFFSTESRPDEADDPTTNILWITQAELGLPAVDYYLERDSILSLYESVAAKTLEAVYTQVLGREYTDTERLATGILELETRLANVSASRNDLDDPQTARNKYSAAELSDILQAVSFRDYVAAFAPRPDFPDPVVITSAAYLGNVTPIIDATAPDVLEAYFVFRAILQFAPFLGPNVAVRFEVERLTNALGGIPEGVRIPREEACLNSLLDNYGFLIGRYFVNHAFTGNSKEYAEEIINAVIAAFKRRLPELSWLDDATREIAEEKALSLIHKIGFPDASPNTSDPTSLARFYYGKLPVTRENYFENVLHSTIADTIKEWATVSRPVDKDAWEMLPSEVNAYYNPPLNEIVFPAGILQSPIFNKGWPEYLAFGAFGAIAGHELTHAFDKSGKEYNKDGRLENWWTNETAHRFEKLKGCLVDQYANYTIVDDNGKEYPINSEYTNGEDMADNGGIAQAFNAWKYRQDHDFGHNYNNLLLPGLNFTREQLFFLSFGSIWANNINPAEAVRLIRTDPHSPAAYRVRGALSNNDEFSAAFGCQAGQPMSNLKKCKVW